MNRLPSFSSAFPRAADPKRRHRTPHRLGGLLLVLGIMASLSCDEPVGPEDYRVVGRIDFSDVRGYEPQVPEIATTGVPFEVTAWTMGNGCYERGDTEVEIDGSAAVVTPYDYDYGAARGVCTAELRRFRHKGIVVFGESGTAEVVLRYSTNVLYNADGRKVFTVEVSPAG